MTKMNGARVLTATLAQAGVRRIFTLSGNHIMPVFDACLDAGIELLHTRHEAAAVHMADAWARLTGEVGVALVTGGPGHANAVSALYTAQMAESPVLLLSGHAPNAQLGMGAFQEMRQADLAAPVTKLARTVRQAGDIAHETVRALRTARDGRPGPVHLSLPTDVLEVACDDASWSDLSPADFMPPARCLAPEAAASIMNTLGRARRPLILCGPAAMAGAMRSKVLALQQACGIAVIGMESPRGIADPALGAFAQMLAQADCILLLGKRLDFTLKFGRRPAIDAACALLQVDAQATEIERTRRAVGARLQVAALADLNSALAALLQTSVTPHGGREWYDDVLSALAYRPPGWAQASAAPGRLHPAQLFGPVQQLLEGHPDSVLICDGGEIGQWAQACLRAPHRIINGVAGAIGAALPFALAARLARPGAPVVAVMGDGTFGFHPAEIDTAVRYRLPFIAVVGNDARWNAEYQIQLRDYGPGRQTGCDLLPARYDQVTAAFGGHGALVTDAGALPAALRQAADSDLPACINVMIEGLAAPDIKRPTA